MNLDKVITVVETDSFTLVEPSGFSLVDDSTGVVVQPFTGQIACIDLRSGLVFRVLQPGVASRDSAMERLSRVNSIEWFGALGVQEASDQCSDFSNGVESKVVESKFFSIEHDQSDGELFAVSKSYVARIKDNVRCAHAPVVNLIRLIPRSDQNAMQYVCTFWPSESAYPQNWSITRGRDGVFWLGVFNSDDYADSVSLSTPFMQPFYIDGSPVSVPLMVPRLGFSGSSAMNYYHNVAMMNGRLVHVHRNELSFVVVDLSDGNYQQFTSERANIAGNNVAETVSDVVLDWATDNRLGVTYTTTDSMSHSTTVVATYAFGDEGLILERLETLPEAGEVAGRAIIEADGELQTEFVLFFSDSTWKVGSRRAK